MTINEFQKRYHGYSVDSEQEASIEAMKLKVIDENGKQEVIHPIKLGNKWCLMLNRAAKLLDDLGMI